MSDAIKETSFAPCQTIARSLGVPRSAVMRAAARGDVRTQQVLGRLFYAVQDAERVLGRAAVPA